MYVGGWGGLDIYAEPNPDDNGNFKIKAMQSTDILVARPDAFAVSKDAV